MLQPAAANGDVTMAEPNGEPVPEKEATAEEPEKSPAAEVGDAPADAISEDAGPADDKKDDGDEDEEETLSREEVEKLHPGKDISWEDGQWVITEVISHVRTKPRQAKEEDYDKSLGVFKEDEDIGEGTYGE